MKREDIKTAEEILNNNASVYVYHVDEDYFYELTSSNPQDALKVAIQSLKEYASQFIDLASEEATTCEQKHGVFDEDFFNATVVSKQSILNIKELIK